MMTHLPPSRFFPPASEAGADGLVYFGGRLTPDWLLDAYSQGIFPWPFSEDDAILAWWSPDPRAVIELDALHIPRRLKRTLRSDRFSVTCDSDFSGVIRGCATAQHRSGNTWLGPPMIRAYERMHQLGHAHSVEVRHEGRLVGGTYGLAIGGLFAAESMFYAMSDASKVALVHLVSHLRARGYALLDIQQLTPHTSRFGAHTISRDDYLARLAVALRAAATFGDTLERNIDD
jgi:leucyl/phenylalanyl-tRNA--protein transferase